MICWLTNRRGWLNDAWPIDTLLSSWRIDGWLNDGCQIDVVSLIDPKVESQAYKSYNYTGQWHQKLFSLFNEPRPTYFWDNFVFYVWIYFPELNKIPPMGQIITMFKNRLRLWMDFFTMMKLSAIVLGEPSLCSPLQFEPGPLFKAPYFYIVALLRWSKKTFISWRQVFSRFRTIGEIFEFGEPIS